MFKTFFNPSLTSHLNARLIHVPCLDSHTVFLASPHMYFSDLGFSYCSCSFSIFHDCAYLFNLSPAGAFADLLLLIHIRKAFWHNVPRLHEMFCIILKKLCHLVNQKTYNVSIVVCIWDVFSVSFDFIYPFQFETNIKSLISCKCNRHWKI